MKLNEGFGLRKVCGENVLVAEGLKNINYGKIINLNDTAAYLWTSLVGKTFEVEDMVDLLRNEYEVSADIALADSEELVKKWIEAGLIEL